MAVKLKLSSITEKDDMMKQVGSTSTCDQRTNGACDNPGFIVVEKAVLSNEDATLLHESPNARQ